MLERDVYCQECGQWFVATGNGGFVDCPFCGTNLELSYVVKEGRVVNERLYNQIGRPEYDATPMPKPAPRTRQAHQPISLQNRPQQNISAKKKQEQNIAPVVISALVVVAIFFGVVIFATVNIEKPTPVPQQDNSMPYYPENSGSDYSSSYDCNSNTQSESSSSSSNTGFQTNTSNSKYVLPVQDAEEDAYEEARSLKKEDILNRTRNHEGDNYNGYDDDYDEGYDE